MKTENKMFRSLAALAVVAMLVVSCEVTNPGPVADDVLTEELSWPGVVAGMGRALSNFVDEVAYIGAAVTREIHPSGSTGSYGITPKKQLGELAVDENSGQWNDAQQARWVAEDGIARMLGSAPYDDEPPEVAPDPELLAEAYLYAGYANRGFAENFCETVIDGGSAQPSSTLLDVAAAHFGNAIANAEAGSDLELAGYAGRASVYVLQGNWALAVADAGQVTDAGFAFTTSYSASFTSEEYNTIYFASAAEPYKAHSVWNTAYGDSAWTWGDGVTPEQYASGLQGSYFVFEPNDPRVAFDRVVDLGDAAIACCGNVPWWVQTKYTSESASINLSSVEEMRVIEAENLLINGDPSGAIDILNQLRTEAGAAAAVPVVLAQWDNTVSSDSAWAILKRERGIVLWLEGRRMADFRRWEANSTPGALDPLEMVGDAAAPYEPSHLRQQDLCFPIPDSEEQTNPNISYSVVSGRN